MGSALNSNLTAQLAPLAVGSDLDGGLLVSEDSQLFTGGFAYGSSGEIILPQRGLMLGMKLKPAGFEPILSWSTRSAPEF